LTAITAKKASFVGMLEALPKRRGTGSGVLPQKMPGYCFEGRKIETPALPPQNTSPAKFKSTGS
jgi:hypothetical protein